MNENMKTEMIHSTNPPSVCYEGDLSSQTIYDIFDELENVVFKNESVNAKRKILITCIELLQNVQNYYAKNKLAHAPLKFCIRQQQSNVLIEVESELLKKDKSAMGKKLAEICLLAPNELKERIKHKLHHSTLNSTSAGIGLLEIVLYTEGNLNYSFEKKTPEKFLLKLAAKINIQ